MSFLVEGCTVRRGSVLAHKEGGAVIALHQTIRDPPFVLVPVPAAVIQCIEQSHGYCLGEILEEYKKQLTGTQARRVGQNNVTCTAYAALRARE